MKFGLFYFLSAPKPLDSDEWGPGEECQKFQEALEQVEFAETCGFDYIYALEHHFRREYSCLSGSDLFLAALSQRTKTMRLVTGIMQNPPALNHPVRVAERAATLDLLSKGRFELGTGHGTLPELVPFLGPELAADFFPEGGRAMWREGLRESVRMFEDATYPGYEGQYFSVPMVNVVPKPLQKPHPPLWTAAASVDMNVEAAGLGIGALNISLLGIEAARERVTAYWDRIREGITPIGKTVNPGVATVAFAHLASSEELAIERGARGMDWFGFALRRSSQAINQSDVHINREFDAAWRSTLREDADPTQGSGRGADDGIAPPHRVTASPGCLLSTPEQALSYIRQLEEANVDIAVFAVQSGDIAHEHILETLELFGRDIIPEFKERQPEHNRWRSEQVAKIDAPVYSSMD